MKKLTSMIILVMLITSFGAVFPIENVKANGTTLYVGGSGSGNYSTINQALSDAIDGDTIYVFSGTYNGYYNIDKSVHLKGENKYSTILTAKFYWGVITTFASDISIENFTISDNDFGHGVWIREDTNNIVVRNNNIHDNTAIAILLHSQPNNCIIENNSIRGSSGIWVSTGEGTNIIRHNTIEVSSGIMLEHASNNIISNNTFLNNYGGVYLYRDDCTNNLVENNNFFQCGKGIEIFDYGNNNTIRDNTFESNSNGIIIDSSAKDNNLYHNNFILNTVQASDAGENIWDDGYPSGGNYWSNFNEPGEGAFDDYSGVNQDIAGSDGIVDSCYYIPDGDNLDHYPLLYPWPQNQPPIADAGGPYEANESTQINFDASFSSDPDGDSLTYAWDLDDDGEFDDATGANPTYTWCDDYTGVVSVEVSDGIDTDIASTTVIINNVDPIITNFTASPGLVEIDGTVTFYASFTDTDCDTFNAYFDWNNDGTYDQTLNSVTGPIQETNSFSNTGVYTVKLKIEDDDEGFDTEIYQYVVVYNSTGAFVTGGGWIDSPAGAYPENPTLTGTANFGFVSKYKKGTPTPIGNTQFKFKLADLDFKSESYDWLVVTNHKAMYKGNGTVNGDDNYGFMLSAIDEDLTPSTDVDLFRIKIWDKDNDDVVIYDNQLGEDEDEDPSTQISSGSIKIHKVN